MDAQDGGRFVRLVRNPVVRWVVGGVVVVVVAGAAVSGSSGSEEVPGGVVTTTAASPPDPAAPMTDPGPPASDPAPTATDPAAPTTDPATPRTTDPAGPTTTDPATAEVPVGDLPGWRQTFVEDFTTPVAVGGFPGAAYQDRWHAYDGFPDTRRLGRYDAARTLSVGDGALSIDLQTVEGVPRLGAVVPLLDGTWGGQVHGKFSVRFRADSIPGYDAAVLLWTDSNTWSEGEINFAEGNLDGTINVFNHCLGEHPEVACLNLDTGAVFDDWHVASVEWTADAVTFLLDGAVVGTSDVVPTSPMHLVLQTGTRVEGAPAAARGAVQVDWVAIYERA